MVFSDLLLCACDNKHDYLTQNRKTNALNPLLSLREKEAAVEQEKLDHILSQIGLENLQKFHAPIAPSAAAAERLADLPVAVKLLDLMLRSDWQTEGARVSARDALAHEFFGKGEGSPAVEGRDEEQRMERVRSDLQQLEKVRARVNVCSMSRLFLWASFPLIPSPRKVLLQAAAQKTNSGRKLMMWWIKSAQQRWRDESILPA